MSDLNCTSSIKILGISDEDPFHPQTWSRSSRFFFSALQEQGALTNAISAEPSTLVRRLHQLKNITPNIDTWRFKYHLDTSYYDAMTKVAKKRIQHYPPATSNCLLQIGAWYDLSTCEGYTKASYHDGNLATLLSSPYGHPKINEKYIKRTLRYEKELYQKMDYIFPMSSWLANSFVEDFGVDPDKVFPVGAGINLSKIKNTEGRSHNSNAVLMVGKDFKRKGGDNLLKAFEQVVKVVPDATLRIIGPSQITDLPDYAVCLGTVDSASDDGLERLLSEYMNAQVFAMPSLYEPFGIAFAEAMAHRLPCIGTNICAMPELIAQGESGYLTPPGDIDELAKRLIELLTSPEQCTRMGNAGFQRYQEHFNWPTVARKIVNILSQ